MPKRPPGTDTKPSHTKDTRRAYLKGGLLLLARAEKKLEAPGDIVDALMALFSDPNLVLRPATTRQYKQQLRAVIGYKLHQGELERDRAVSGLADLTALLKDRRGPCPKRTSSAKRKTPTKAEYLAICSDFNRRWKLAGALDNTDTVLSLMVALGPYLGLRPVEWLNTYDPWQKNDRSQREIDQRALGRQDPHHPARQLSGGDRTPGSAAGRQTALPFR